MCKIKYVSAGLDHAILENEKFSCLFFIINDKLAHAHESMKTKYLKDDYCIFINIDYNEKHNFITFHDGGATFNPITNDLDYSYYLSIKTDLLLSHSYQLYYSIEEEIICLLSER